MNVKIEISKKENDQRVLGIFIGPSTKKFDSFNNPIGDYDKEGNWKRGEAFSVAAIGDTFDIAEKSELKGAKVCNSNGEIKIGDLLATSNIPGCLQKQDDDLIHSYTIGKAAQTANFKENGQDYIHMFLYSG